jgi:hypothetical protein
MATSLEGPDTRLPAARSPQESLLLRLEDPKTLDALNRLLDRLDVIAWSAEALEGFLGRGNEVAESMAEGAGQLVALAPQVDGEQLRKALSALPSLVEAGTLLADAGMFEARTVKGLADLGRSVADSHEEVRTTPPKPLGLLTLLRALRDPQIARSLQVALETAKRYGRQLE